MLVYQRVSLRYPKMGMDQDMTVIHIQVPAMVFSRWSSLYQHLHGMGGLKITLNPTYCSISTMSPWVHTLQQNQHDFMDQSTKSGWWFFATPLKMMDNSSVGMMKFPTEWESHKIPWFQSPPTSIYVCYISVVIPVLYPNDDNEIPIWVTGIGMVYWDNIALSRSPVSSPETVLRWSNTAGNSRTQWIFKMEDPGRIL